VERMKKRMGPVVEGIRKRVRPNSGRNETESGAIVERMRVSYLMDEVA